MRLQAIQEDAKDSEKEDSKFTPHLLVLINRRLIEFFLYEEIYSILM